MPAGYHPHIQSSKMYNPYGSLQPGRYSQTAVTSRYGFNGMEKDDEVKGEGNSYTTLYRQYDARIGKWMSLDPEMTQLPWQSPFASMSNNPVLRIDPLGNLDTKYVTEDEEVITDTKDGSDDVIVVPKEEEDNFRELVRITPETKLNSPKFNINMKARFLGFKSIQAMEGALNSLRWQTSRQKLIDYYQSNSIGNGTGLIALYYLEFNTNIWNYLPSPNFRIGATIKTPKIRQARLKSSTKPQSNTTSIKKSDATSIELNSN